MDVLIESTKNFENDLSILSDAEREVVIAKINDLADLSSTHKSSVGNFVALMLLHLLVVTNLLCTLLKSLQSGLSYYQSMKTQFLTKLYLLCLE
jgi:hypothetical protein